MKKGMLFASLLFTLSFLCGCTNQVTTKVEAEDFVLTVQTPRTVNIGEEFDVIGTLTYVGKEAVELAMGREVILFYLSDSHGHFERSMVERLPGPVIHEVAPKQSFEAVKTYSLYQPGIYELDVRTVRIEVNQEPIEGQRLFNSRNQLVLDPISIKVKE